MKQRTITTTVIVASTLTVVFMLTACHNNPIHFLNTNSMKTKSIVHKQSPTDSLPNFLTKSQLAASQQDICDSSPIEDCISRKNNKHFVDSDFDRPDSNGVTVFQKQITINNVLCKLPCDDSSAANFMYTFDEYLAVTN